MAALFESVSPAQGPADAAAVAAAAAAPGARVREYWVAADQRDWDYTPQGLDACRGAPFSADQEVCGQLQCRHALGAVAPS